jgi:SAM-dependent methyltransferase
MCWWSSRRDACADLSEPRGETERKLARATREVELAHDTCRVRAAAQIIQQRRWVRHSEPVRDAGRPSIQVRTELGHGFHSPIIAPELFDRSGREARRVGSLVVPETNAAAAGPPTPHWFDAIAAHLGRAYWAPDTGRVMAFTKGTEQEVEFLVDALGLEAGMRVLDVGCGPGRHALALARRGMAVVGVDRSPDFLLLARDATVAAGLVAEFVELDVRDLAFEAEFDAAVCLCQGGFGLLGGRDEPEVFGRIARSLRPGGRLAVSAFSAAFAVRFLEAGEAFDPATGVLHERSTVRDPDGNEREFDLWTTCFTARELELLATVAGLVVDAVHGVAPGRYRAEPPAIADPELLLLARKRHPFAKSGLDL